MVILRAEFEKSNSQSDRLCIQNIAAKLAAYTRQRDQKKMQRSWDTHSEKKNLNLLRKVY